MKELLKSCVNNEKLNMDINDSDIKLLLEQSLQTLLYQVTQNKEYKKYYVSWALKQEQFYNLQAELTNLFNENNKIISTLKVLYYQNHTMTLSSILEIVSLM